MIVHTDTALETTSAQDYDAISTPFAPSEKHLLDSLVSGLAGCRILLVEKPGGIEVHRHRSEINKILPPSVQSVIKVHVGGKE